VYKQSLQRINNYSVHDELGIARRGDTVTIHPAGRRLSTTKSYILQEVKASANARRKKAVEQRAGASVGGAKEGAEAGATAGSRGSGGIEKSVSQSTDTVAAADPA